MPTDLRSRFEDAVGTPEPAPVDTDALWVRGRRQRRAQQATPVLAVLAVLGLGLGAVVAVSNAPRDAGPVAPPIEDGRDPDPTGWTRVEPGEVVVATEVTVATEEDVDVTTHLLGHPQTQFGGFDVREDGAVVTVFHDRERGGIMVRHPQDEGWTRIGMPVAFLEDDAGYALHTVQWGPDGRIYLTGMAPDATNRNVGLTQVAVVEEDGTVVGVRENDAGQTAPFLFTEGYAWQRQISEGREERWQPVAEIGGRVLQMPDQRAGEHRGDVAPDGMALEYTFENENEPVVFDGIAGDARVRWGAEFGIGAGLWDHPVAGVRVGATVPARPAGGVLSWLTDEVDQDGALLSILRADGDIVAVHLPADVAGEAWGLVSGSDAVIGGDGRLHWVTHTPDGPVIRSYRHPLP